MVTPRRGNILALLYAGLGFLTSMNTASAQTVDHRMAEIAASARLHAVILPAPTRGDISATAGVPDSVVQHTQPNQWFRGAVIGAGVGAVVMGALGAAVCGLDDEGHSCGYYIGRFALLGIPVGGVVGALIGSNVPKHEPAHQGQE